MRYLQKRKYSSNMTEAYKRLNTSIHRGQPLVQSKAQLAVRELLRSEAGSTATVALSSPPNVDPLVIEQQYAKFKVRIFKIVRFILIYSIVLVFVYCL